MQNLEVIQDALRLIGVLPEGQTASAEQGEDALRTMNDLLAEWSADGIEVGHFPQTDTTEDFPAGYEVAAAIKYNLALHLAPQYGRQVDQVVGVFAEKFYKRLLRDAVVSNIKEVDVTYVPGGTGHFDLLTDG